MRNAEILIVYPLFFIPVLLMGLLIFGMGAKVIITRRPQIISMRWFYGLYGVFLLVLVFIQGRSMPKDWNDDYFWLSVLMFAILVGTAVLMLFIFRRYLDRYQIIGATDESFRAAALAVFEGLGIPAEQRLSYFELPSLAAKLQVIGNFRSGAAMIAIEGAEDKTTIKKVVGGMRAFFHVERVKVKYTAAVWYALGGLILSLFLLSYGGAFGYLLEIINPIAFFGTMLLSFPLLAGFALFLGAKALVTRKPLMVSSRWFVGFGVVLWLSYLSINVSMLFSKWWYRPVMVYGGLGLSLLLFIALVFALRRQSPWYFVMGTKAESIRLGILTFFESNHVPYEESLSGLKLPSLGAELEFQAAPGSGLGFLRVKGMKDKSKLGAIVGFMKGYFGSDDVGLDYQPAVLFVLFGLAILVPAIALVVVVSSLFNLLSIF